MLTTHSIALQTNTYGIIYNTHNSLACSIFYYTIKKHTYNIHHTHSINNLIRHSINMLVTHSA